MKNESLDISTLESQVFLKADNHNRQHVYLKSTLEIGQKKKFEFTTRHSKHSRKRASQRSFDHNLLSYILLLGSAFYKQGLIFYTVMEKDIPEGLDHEIAEKIRNLVVVTGNHDHQIITCYYAKNAVKHLRRKGKELKK